ncbi:MAG: group 2 glycosyl transferase [Candidatus Berkelbacteria bacterium Licking1014_7]|uniref:Group 2 glycosyl transferase n=1 Tax=Candidatus Berkelbacteria bacterium Licking1014_7 TaxID=2017147 RepID=A0A554LKS9_9BACT|nr:MAG: group 2 glycosyl transferase [Candidatus Berkelbacteria bacterium Licking1014_7]
MKKLSKSNGDLRQKKPKMAILSFGIRRDLHQPLKYFQKITIVHFYFESNYNDMKPGDFSYPSAQRFSTMIDLYKKLASAAPDIIQTSEAWATNSIALKITLVSFWYCLFHKVKLVYPVLENRPIEKKFSPVKTWLLKKWVGFFSKWADKIFYLNEGARRNLLWAALPEKKLQKAMWGTWGIDTNEFKPAQMTIAQKYQNPLIFFVGKISRAKGVPWILDAFQIVNKKYPQVKLLLAGQPEDKKILARIERMKNARFLGIIKNSDLAKYFQKTFITLAPSITTKVWEEQVGMVNLQSMACATPVISTRSGAIPEFISDGKGCALVKEKNSSEIARALQKFLQDKKYYKDQSKKAVKWVVKHYNAHQNIANLEKKLLDLLDF